MDSLLEINPDGADPTQAELAAKKGWYLAFKSGVHTREQVVTSAVVVGGVVFFSTHTPTSAGICTSNLGTARAYSVRFLDASTPYGDTRYAEFIGGGLPPSPVAGVVEVDNPSGEGTIKMPFIIGGRQPEGASSPLESFNPGLTGPDTRKRTHWYLQQ